MQEMVGIGVAAKYLGVTTKTMRIWEDTEGYITKGNVTIKVYRTNGKIRRYVVEDLERLRQVRV
ncbi:MerR HTH family regulatory protein [Anaerocolumna jejuensis DSM 15929]|uniref:MerR HTH family regulatory protein n=1 Tax=Anaerocolumna jejuensis DSM 15929 TaxID=1121322 RepID=A0A1M6KIE7_9FIRM|nr:MerR family transcriptional regulator [Anaerocolumna jejuensis]SHJ58727.1 MerR HTH family regulatory protein [Anaerocolumna jejuensis DSM 15929]